MPAKLDSLQKAIKKQLKKDNPGLSEDELEKRSWAIAQAQFKKIKNKESIDSNDKFDEDGRYIVSENTKMYINAGIDIIEE